MVSLVSTHRVPLHLNFTELWVQVGHRLVATSIRRMPKGSISISGLLRAKSTQQLGHSLSGHYHPKLGGLQNGRQADGEEGSEYGERRGYRRFFRFAYAELVETEPPTTSCWFHKRVLCRPSTNQGIWKAYPPSRDYLTVAVVRFNSSSLTPRTDVLQCLFGDKLP